MATGNRLPASIPSPAVSVLVGVAALLLYLALGQDGFHELDIDFLIPAVATGVYDHPAHFLYLPIVRAVWSVTEPLDFAVHESMVLASALGGGLGAGLVHRAAAVVLGNARQALLTAMLCATVPATVYFATVVEIPGVFLAFIGLSWWAFACFLRAPAPWTAVALGASTGLAGTAHATGHLLPAVMLVWFVAEHGLLRAGRRRSFVVIGLVGIVHAIVAVALTGLVRGDGVPSPIGSQLGMFMERATNELGHILPLSHLPSTFWDEWLRPYAILSVTGLAAVFTGPSRRLARGLLLPIGIYLAVTFLMLGPIVERGAYFLPLSLPVAVVIVRWLRPAAVLVLAILTLAIAVHDVIEHDVRHGDDAFAEGLQDLSDDTPAFLLAIGDQETHPILRCTPKIPFVRIYNVGLLVARTEFAASFDAFIAGLSASGLTLYLSSETLALMEGGPLPIFEGFVKGHLRNRYTLEPVQSKGFSGVRLRPR